MIRSQIPRFRLPESGDRRGGRLHHRPRRHRDCASASGSTACKALLDEGYDAVFVGTGAPRGRDLDMPGRAGGRGQHPHRHRLALERLLRPHRQDRPARDRAGRRQHRHGLLPHLAPARRRGRQGDRPLRLRGDEGVALGEGGRDARGHPDPQLPRAQGLHPRGRPADRRPLREGRGAPRRRGAAASSCRPASPTCTSNATTCWSPSARRTPSPGSSATSASSSTVGACRRSTRSPCSRPTPGSSSAATRPSGPRTSSGPWRTATRRRSRSTSSAAARTCASARRRDVHLVSQKMGIHEWSYDNDISLDQRYRVPLLDTGVALQNVKVEVELGFDRELAYARGAALPELRRPDGVQRGRSASSATPASTSARSTASPSPRTGRRTTCAPG